MARKRKDQQQLRQQAMKRSRRAKKQSGWFGKFRLILGLLLIVAAGVLLALNPIKNQMIAEGTRANSIANITREDIVANQEVEVEYDWDVIEAIDPLNVISNGVNPSDLPTIGGIAIPEVGMNLPIYKGVSQAGMYYGAGTLYADQEMGKSNYSLASHHSIDDSLLFAPLLRVEHGQTIYLTDLDQVHAYEITNIAEVPAEAIEVTYPTETPTVTLITCDSNLVNRIIVQGELVESVPIAKASQKMIDAFDIPQTIVQ